MVRNKYVKIQHGKEIVRKNNILDAYPEHIAKRQMGTLDTTSTGINETDNQFELSTLLLKLDTPLEGLKEMGVNKLNITGEDLEGDLSVVNNGDNSLTINGSLPVDEGTTQEGTSFTLTDAQPNKKASITKLEGNTSQSGTPTPSSPIEVKTVSGDNEVVVCGKNRLKINDFILGSNGLTYTCTNGIIRIQGTAGNLGYSTLELTPYVNINELNAIPNGTQLTFSVLGITGIGAGQIFIGQTGNLYYWQPSASTKMISKSKSAEITRVVIWFTTTQGQTYDIYMNPQFEVGSTATDYEEHKGNSYRVDFGGKNEFHDYYQITDTNNGITRTLTDNGIKLNGTYNKSANMDLWLTKSTSAGYSNNMTLLKANTQYTISIRAISGSFNISNITCNLSSRTVADKTFAWNYQTLTLSNNVWKKTFTPTTDIYVGGVRLYFNKSNTTAVFNNAELGIQIEKGTTDTQFSPYVSNPIELCKIGSYVDKLKRAEGKNLCSNIQLQDANNIRYYFDKTISKTFTFSTIVNVATANNSIYLVVDGTNYGRIGTISGTANTIISGTYTLSDDNYQAIQNGNECYLLLYKSSAGFTLPSYAMINEGSTALPYEPYGTNWYIEKNIGKVNMEDYNWTKYGTNITGINRFATTGIPNVKYVANNKQLGDALSNMYANHTGSGMSGVAYNFCIDTNMVQTTDDSSLTKPRGVLYYALKTPEYEIITNENLIQQLNNIQNIELIENLCYVDWVGKEKPTMTLKYNYETEYEYDLGVQDFTLSANTNYNVNANGLSLKLANNSAIYEGAGTYTPTQDTEVTSVKLLIPLGVNFSSTVYPTVEKQSGLRNTEFDVHYVDSLDISVTNYKCFTTLTKNGCIARYQYTYDRHSRFRSYRDGQVYDMADLNGRRITAIGFACNWIGGGSYQSTREVLAVLDTSNYALYINQEIPMNITRVDEITSDAEFYTNNTEITGPLHLDPLRTNCDKERGGI